jgi:asparagine synthase (glutamine-hydrolysing)
MCGIAGVLNAPSSVALEPVTRAMADSLIRRGPDDSGVWVDAARRVALGHRRLSVLDLSAAGHQPMASSCSRYVTVFNGEIYNHARLRTELEATGHAPAWRGHSDTETLLAGVAAWGLEETLRRSVGMFALAVWDRQERVLQLARDRVGEKPLYYGYAGGALVFGSELKALRSYPGMRLEVDRQSLALYMQFASVPAPLSIFVGVRKLEPGTILTVPLECPAEVRVQRYWSLSEVARAGSAKPLCDPVEAADALEEVLRSAVRAQCFADVPVGAFLSGGVDSSTIAALMQQEAGRQVQTFTIGFAESGFSEAPFARAVANHLGTEHHELEVSATDAYNLIPKLPQVYDEPFADSSQIPTWFVCRAARSRVTVALSGDGADELFGGYNRYLWGNRLWNKVKHLPVPLRKAIAQVATSVPESAWNRVGHWMPRQSRLQHLGGKVHRLAHQLSGVQSPEDLYRVSVAHWPSASNPVLGADGAWLAAFPDLAMAEGIEGPEQRMMLWDALGYLPNDILTKVDRAAMSQSLETRAPFLDHNVIELAWRLPLAMKIRPGTSKWALREVLYRHVPRELIERPKVGFSMPLGQWLRGPLRDWAENLLLEGRLRREGYLDSELVRRTWEEHLTGVRDWSARLWCVLMFEAWLEGQT